MHTKMRIAQMVLVVYFVGNMYLNKPFIQAYKYYYLNYYLYLVNSKNKRHASALSVEKRATCTRRLTSIRIGKLRH